MKIKIIYLVYLKKQILKIETLIFVVILETYFVEASNFLSLLA